MALWCGILFVRGSNPGGQIHLKNTSAEFRVKLRDRVQAAGSHTSEQWTFEVELDKRLKITGLCGFTQRCRLGCDDLRSTGHWGFALFESG